MNWPYQAILGVLAATLLFSPHAQAEEGDPWQHPSPQRIERFLEVFAPELAPSQALENYGVAVQRLIAISNAWGHGDRLGASDLILAPGESSDLAPLQEARVGLQTCRALAAWWSDPEARSAFVRYYNDVYLTDLALAKEQEAFAKRFLQGASITDEHEPARYLYTHLTDYGYTASGGLTPANYLFDLYGRFDRAVADAARLGLPQDQFVLDLSLYRNGVISRLITQIQQSRQFADARLQGVDTWGETIAGTTAPPMPDDAFPVVDATPMVDEAPIEDPAITFLETPEESDVSPPFFPPETSKPMTETVQPVIAPVAPDPLAGIDIFRTPDDQTPLSAAPAVVIPGGNDSDPEVFATPAEVDTAIIEMIQDPEDDADLIEDGPGAITDLFELPTEPLIEEAPVDPIIGDLEAMPIIEELPAEPAADSAARAANRAAGEAMRTKALEHARTVGGYAMDLVLLWKSPEYATAEGKAADTALTDKFKKEKDRLLASLYLLDIYGVHARLSITDEALDGALLDALQAKYFERKDADDQQVVALMIDIDAALAKLADGVTTRRTNDSVALAQQRAYDQLKGNEFAAIARQLEETTLM